MKSKVIDVGRITGLSSYELAVKHGFTGTEKEFIKKETAVYEDMKDYADDSKAEMNRLIASITDSSTDTDAVEIAASRGSFDSLPDRLNDSDKQLSDILARLKSIDKGGDIIQGGYIDDEGYLVVRVKDGYEQNVYGNIELRNNGTQIQWRSSGFTDWRSLVYLRELMPKFTDLIVNSISQNEKASGSVTTSGDRQILTLNIPRGKDGIDGGQILDAEINDAGELILTVANNDFVTVNGDPYPMLSIGEVKTVSPDKGASASITGTPTNPKLNLNIPRGKTTKLNSAYVGSDGKLVFSYVEEV